MTDLDVGTLLAALFTHWFGPIVGPVAGVYSVVLIAAITGSGFALARRDPNSRPGSIPFVLLMTAATVLTTVPVSAILSKFVQALTAQITIPIVALIIAGIGDDWADFGRSAWGVVAGRLGARK